MMLSIDYRSMLILFEIFGRMAISHECGRFLMEKADNTTVKKSTSKRQMLVEIAFRCVALGLLMKQLWGARQMRIAMRFDFNDMPSAFSFILSALVNATYTSTAKKIWFLSCWQIFSTTIRRCDDSTGKGYIEFYPFYSVDWMSLLPTNKIMTLCAICTWLMRLRVRAQSICASLILAWRGCFGLCGEQLQSTSRRWWRGRSVDDK